MTENNKHKIHVPITATENIDSVSTGKITGPSWDPAAGLRRQEQIQQAREEAAAELRKQTQERDPIWIRVAALEAVVQHLQAELKELKANAS